MFPPSKLIIQNQHFNEYGKFSSSKVIDKVVDKGIWWEIWVSKGPKTC